ncbi:hypothetical protein [Streptomyces sp. NPDC058103]|uniref:hypothetical protein n=1 Tax=Streptomyces sp. NPDC058103 TaxID=3346341 RepID=UPI0036EF9303
MSVLGGRHARSADRRVVPAAAIGPPSDVSPLSVGPPAPVGAYGDHGARADTPEALARALPPALTTPGPP